MEQIFALDIGTRMVMGLIMTKKRDHGYEILARLNLQTIIMPKAIIVLDTILLPAGMREKR